MELVYKNLKPWYLSMRKNIKFHFSAQEKQNLRTLEAYFLYLRVRPTEIVNKNSHIRKLTSVVHSLFS